VLVASRLPRVLACVVVGLALGVAGATLQSVARNPLASPDTLAVNSGAYLAVVAAAAFGLSLPTLPGGALAFLGGLAAAGLVFALSAGGTAGATRLVLAGSAVAIALQSFAYVLLLLFEQQTLGLFAWGEGSLVQSDLDAVSWMSPVVVAAAAASVATAHRLDILALGDDTASVLGLRPARTRLVAVLLAVLLTAASVTVAGPIGFVGLCAPVAVRLVAPYVRGLHRHRALLPMAGVTGVVVVLGADVLLRAVLGAERGVDIPAGVVTTIAGAAVLVAVARRLRDSGPARPAPAAPGRARPGLPFGLVMALGSVGLAGALVAGLLLGDTVLLLGDVANWISGRSGTVVTFVLDQRLPRVAAAVLAGAALAVAGALVQGVCRNPLAEPGLLGITGGAGIGAITVLGLAPSAGLWGMTSAAAVGAVAAFAVVYGLAWRGGLDTDRLVLMGVGVWAGSFAAITLVVVLVNPWDTGLALTWLSGSTYGRTLPQVAPVAVGLTVAMLAVASLRRELDLLAVDDDVPRVVGVRLERTRLAILLVAALLTATAVCAVGVIGFVGLVAPHAARALVGGRHARLVPASALLGAVLVSVADTVGRTVIAPAQIPAGLVTALIGTPYFVWLLWRSRR
jgi:iron complex transport system permease protein